MIHYTRRDFLKTIGSGAASIAITGCTNASEYLAEPKRGEKPNILFCISDDQSWAYTSAMGCKVVNTPNFDRIAREGILFTNAYCAAPSCTPSRSAILTGQHIWRLEEAGQLFGELPAKFRVYTKMVAEQAGYFIGVTGKGWGPGVTVQWETNPVGKPYNKIRKPAFPHASNNDYAANFEAFLKDRPKEKPFCFWFGCTEPHRGYSKGIGKKNGKKTEDVLVPAFLPDVGEVRSDILDYCVEIEWFDKHLGRMIKALEDIGELDNTIIVVTSDNGMPFPRAKCNLYDYGVRMPLAVRWGEKCKGNRVVDDFISLTDMAPTFLEAAGIDVPSEMTGRSFLNILLSGKSGRVDPKRGKVFTARERHTVCRKNDLGYPMRAIRTHDFLYIRNYEPDRWPAGSPRMKSAHGWLFGDIDQSPTYDYMLQNKQNPDVASLFKLGYLKRPPEELYDVKKDPYQINNLADNTRYFRIKTKLREQLEKYLKETRDPRAEGKSPWDKYPYYWKNPKGLMPYKKSQQNSA